MRCYRQSIRIRESLGSVVAAARIRLRVAAMLDFEGRTDEALRYAKDAANDIRHIDSSTSEAALAVSSSSGSSQVL